MRLKHLLFIPLILMTACNDERDQIRVAGSSTVFPFVSYAAEQFGRNTEFKTPIIEATGTGGGFKIFCGGIGPQYADMSNASRAIKEKEVALCAEHGVTDITELSVGFDGIVLANTKEAEPYALTIDQVFLSLAKEVPQNGKLVENFYESWSDINPSLPNTKIEVYGPPPTSGTRDAFVEIVMEKGCKAYAEYEAAYPDKKARAKACHALREDGGFIDAGENDNIIVQKLKANPTSLGIFGYSFLEQNAAHVQGSSIDGVDPSFDNIADGSYPVARSLFVYIKDQHVGLIPGMTEFLEELFSDDAMSEDGYLPPIGLIPLPAEQQAEMRFRIEKLKLR